eukprot:gnl/MRDRNA2_/MRDRNA2_28652_c0_seq1.p1 gnl/MRDRNA2_/MRDRNA2_28652_c0~~gnl/MRDRNA2_/MRDRNA2_28652_c0_seq1.p1  ORF type:complete len:741 (-),score=168.67 gnl/MRDRNA2_/MRDRNA2_28652_c0_seq1:439-2382(-)
MPLDVIREIIETFIAHQPEMMPLLMANKSVREKNKQLHVELRNEQEKFETLRDFSENLSKRLKDSEALNSKLKKQIDQKEKLNVKLQQELSEKEKLNVKLQQELSGKEKRNVKLQQEVSEIQAQVESLGKQLKEVNISNSEASSILEATQSSVDDVASCVAESASAPHLGDEDAQNLEVEVEDSPKRKKNKAKSTKPQKDLPHPKVQCEQYHEKVDELRKPNFQDEVGQAQAIPDWSFNLLFVCEVRLLQKCVGVFCLIVLVIAMFISSRYHCTELAPDLLSPPDPPTELPHKQPGSAPPFSAKVPTVGKVPPSSKVLPSSQPAPSSANVPPVSKVPSVVKAPPSSKPKENTQIVSMEKTKHTKTGKNDMDLADVKSLAMFYGILYHPLMLKKGIQVMGKLCKEDVVSVVCGIQAAIVIQCTDLSNGALLQMFLNHSAFKESKCISNMHFGMRLDSFMAVAQKIGGHTPGVWIHAEHGDDQVRFQVYKHVDNRVDVKTSKVSKIQGDAMYFPVDKYECVGKASMPEFLKITRGIEKAVRRLSAGKDPDERLLKDVVIMKTESDGSQKPALLISQEAGKLSVTCLTAMSSGFFNPLYLKKLSEIAKVFGVEQDSIMEIGFNHDSPLLLKNDFHNLQGHMRYYLAPVDE